MRVVFFDGHKLHVVREGPPMCGGDMVAIVVKSDAGETTLQNAQAAESREGKLYVELTSMALGCTGMVLGWAVVAGSGGAAPITGGASTFITYLALGGAVAGTAQCLNSAVRVKNELSQPEQNDYLDSQWWYTSLSTFADGVSLVGGLASGAATLRMARALRDSTGKTMLEVLKGLGRQQRKLIAEEAIRIENPGISNGLLKTFVRAGKFPKRFSQKALSQAVKNQLMDATNAALSYAGSALSGVVRQVGGYAVGVVQSVDTY